MEAVVITKNRSILLFYCVASLVFLLIVYLNARSYQDLWILKDIFVPTLIFVLIFCSAVILINDNRLLAVLSSSFFIILNIIPNLKYSLFYGTFDSVIHYGTVNSLLSTGVVPELGYYSSTYSDFPGVHIFMSSISLILGIDSNYALKFFTSVIFAIIPFMIYMVTNKVFDKTIQKGILIGSALPTVTSYVFTGTVFALPLFFCFLCVLLYAILNNNNKKNLQVMPILLIFGFALLFSHAITIIFLLTFLCVTGIFLSFVKRKQVLDSYKPIFSILIVLIISLTIWQMYNAQFIFQNLIKSVQSIFAAESGISIIPSTFFSLSILDKISVLAVEHIKDALVILLCIIGLFILVKKFKPLNRPLFYRFYVPLLFFICSILLVLVIQYASGFGELQYTRFIIYGIVFSPFLTGLFFWHFDLHLKNIKPFLQKLFKILLLFSVISISLIQVFPYQELIPRNTEGTYIQDSRMVNTVYQQRMIGFAERFYCGGEITSDVVTRFQVYGFTDIAFNSNHIWYTQLESSTHLSWDFFLLHYDGISGPLNEKAEYRSSNKISYLKDSMGNLIYDNFESFIIAK